MMQTEATKRQDALNKKKGAMRRKFMQLLTIAVAPALCAMSIDCDQDLKGGGGGGGRVPVTGVRLYYKPFEETRREAIEAGLYQNLNIKVPRLFTMSGEDIGTTRSLTADVQPENATNKELVWRTNHTGVATVENGVVTVKGFGEATITVTTVDGGMTDTFRVVVLTPENETIF